MAWSGAGTQGTVLVAEHLVNRHDHCHLGIMFTLYPGGLSQHVPVFVSGMKPVRAGPFGIRSSPSTCDALPLAIDPKMISPTRLFIVLRRLALHRSLLFDD